MLPVIRQQPFYPGQAGVGGSDVERGLRDRSAGIVLFVDTNHPMKTDDGDGPDPENPLATIGGRSCSLKSNSWRRSRGTRTGASDART